MIKGVRMENRSLLKRGVISLSVAVVSLVLLGGVPLHAKGPVTPKAKRELVQKSTLSEARIDAVLKEAY